MERSLAPGDSTNPKNVSGWNRHVRRLADTFPAGVYHTYGFACECGCGEIIALIATEYDAGGAWLDGHKPAPAGQS